MTGRMIWIGSLLVVCSGLAVWVFRSDPHPDASPTGAPDPTRRTPALAHGKTSEVPAVPVPESIQSGQGTGQQQAMPPRKRRVPQRPPRPGESFPELIAKLFKPPGPTSTAEELQAWEESPLRDDLYPPDHPCAGQPLREKVSRSVLTDHSNEALGPIVDSLPDVDAPQCHIQGSWPYRPLNECAKHLNVQDPASVESLMACLAALPQDPKAYPADIWLPCPAGHPRATTLREYIEGLVDAHVEKIFSASPCTVQ